MPKTKWDGAEDHTINNFYKLITENFEYALKKCAHRPKPEVDRNTPWPQVSPWTHGPPAETHVKCEKIIRTRLPN